MSKLFQVAFIVLCLSILVASRPQAPEQPEPVNSIVYDNVSIKQRLN